MRLSRCLKGFDAIGDGFGTADCNGHGTHCAGIIAGLKSGVAKHAFIHPVRVMGCDGSGSVSSILASLEWIGMNAILPAVVSMSIATKASISIDQAVNNLVNNFGVVSVAASGNFLQDACNYSPSRASSVISVGSSNVANIMSWYSNYGNCTTIFAPGELIVSSYNNSDTAFATLSGTSMACPHVAGAAALYLGCNADALPSEVRQRILDASEPNAVGNVKPSTTQKLLNTNMQEPLVIIHPRSIYNGSEGVAYSISISLKMQPLFNVFLTPYLVDTTIGYFQPKQIVFNTDSSSSIAQTINIVLVKFSDFLDRSSVIQWLFTSRDPRFAVSPEGFIVSHDTDICHKTSANSCGQTSNTPKVIPSLPFYYVENSNLYENVYNSSFDSCHSSGPDVVFQYTASSKMNVTVSLCGNNSQFDTMLSIYEKHVLPSGVTILNKVACNDDYCNIQSSLSQISLQNGHMYIFMIDGYEGDGGLFDFYVIGSTETSMSSLPPSKVATSAIWHLTTSSIEEACTSWISHSCTIAPTMAIQDINGSYFWKATSWGPCDKSCGGGTQDCNMIACLSYRIYEGPWSECNQTCGHGKQTREVICMNSLGHTSSQKYCQGIENYVTQQNCNSESCANSYWEVPIWNFCNVPCSGGVKVRESVCLSQGKVVSEQECFDNPPITEKVCNTHPCQTYAWLVGPWEGCSFGCNSSTTRFVECVDGSGAAVQNETLCNVRLKPASAASCQHIDNTCDDCGINCTGNGECMDGRCICSSEWDGKYCDSPKFCQGSAIGYLQDRNIGCCPHVVVDIEQKCCLNASAVLDVDGNCCESGILDSCGVCDGFATFMDVQNDCCSTVRDGKGVCCLSGFLDECHVCDGDDVSCATNLTITTALNSTLGVPHDASAHWTMFINSFISNVAGRLGIHTQAMILSGVQVEDVVIGNCDNDQDTANGCLIAPTSNLIGIFNFTILPVPLATLQGMQIKKGDILSTLAYKNETDKMVIGANIISVSNVRRTGICGNGICEKGERCNPKGRSDIDDDQHCCLKDCPYVLSSCPSPSSGPKSSIPCSGNGVCLDASGQCNCFKGYTGSDCFQCTLGWTNVKDGICIQITNSSYTIKFALNHGQNPAYDSVASNQFPHLNRTKSGVVLAAIIASAIIAGLICLGLAICAYLPHNRCTSDESRDQPTIQAYEVNRAEVECENLALTWTPALKGQRPASKEESLLQHQIQPNAASKASLLMESADELPSNITPAEEGVVRKWRTSLASPRRGGGMSEWRKAFLPKQLQYELVGIAESSSSSSSSPPQQPTAATTPNPTHDP